MLGHMYYEPLAKFGRINFNFFTIPLRNSTVQLRFTGNSGIPCSKIQEILAPKEPESGKIRTTSKPSSYVSLYLASAKFAFISLSVSKKTGGFFAGGQCFYYFLLLCYWPGSRNRAHLFLLAVMIEHGAPTSGLQEVIHQPGQEQQNDCRAGPGAYDLAVVHHVHP